MKKNNYFMIGAIGVLCAAGALFGVSSIDKDTLKDGTYKAYSSSYNEEGYKPFIVLEVKKGRMIDAIIDGVDENGRLMSKDKCLKYKEIKEKSTFPEAYTKEIRADLLIKQGTSTLMEASTCDDAAATYSAMVNELIEERILQGEEELLITKK